MDLAKVPWAQVLYNKCTRTQELLVSQDSWGTRTFQIAGRIPRNTFNQIQKLKSIDINTSIIPGNYFDKQTGVLVKTQRRRVEEIKKPSRKGELKDPDRVLSTIAYNGEYQIYTYRSIWWVVQKIYQDLILSVYPEASPRVTISPRVTLKQKEQNFRGSSGSAYFVDSILLYMLRDRVIGTIAPIVPAINTLFRDAIEDIPLKKIKK